MSTIITLDGVSSEVIEKTKQEPKVDNLQQNFNQGITSINQQTELEGSLKELNADGIDADTRMSQIDTRTRLRSFEITSVLAVDSLVALGVLPQKCLPLSTQKKRLNVSEGGKGRQEMVELVSGKQDRDMKMGTMGRIKEGIGNFFMGK